MASPFFLCYAVLPSRRGVQSGSGESARRAPTCGLTWTAVSCDWLRFAAVHAADGCLWFSDGAAGYSFLCRCCRLLSCSAAGCVCVCVCFGFVAAVVCLQAVRAPSFFCARRVGHVSSLWYVVLL